MNVVSVCAKGNKFLVNLYHKDRMKKSEANTGRRNVRIRLSSYKNECCSGHCFRRYANSDRNICQL